MTKGRSNLEQMFARADKTDYKEGLLAYTRYRQVMHGIAMHYSQPLHNVVAAFVAMSPNNDYVGNLRSLVSVLHGMRTGIPISRVITSSYRHCQYRAHAYLRGTDDFVSSVSGPKVWNFYHNILFPDDNRYVTVDGHIVATWRGDESMTMKEAIPKAQEYKEIADAIKALAFSEFILPNQYQAIIWFTRKRVCNVRYKSQGNIFDWANGDLWRTVHDVASIKPYTPKAEDDGTLEGTDRDHEQAPDAGTRGARGAPHPDFRDVAPDFGRTGRRVRPTPEPDKQK